MANPANNLTLQGRLTRDVKCFPNQDGSRKYYLDVAVRDNFRSGPENTYQSQFINAEAFVPANVKSPYDSLREADSVLILGSLRSARYTDKTTGQVLFKQFVNIENITILESEKVRNERAARKYQEQQGQAATAPAMAPTAAAPAQTAAPQMPQMPVTQSTPAPTMNPTMAPAAPVMQAPAAAAPVAPMAPTEPAAPTMQQATSSPAPAMAPAANAGMDYPGFPGYGAGAQLPFN